MIEAKERIGNYLKHRVWNKKRCEWVKKMTLVSDNGEVYSFHCGRFRRMNQGENIVEFSSGRTDKNGIEIYEGDIVNWGHGDFSGVATVEQCEIQPAMLLNGNCTAHGSTHDFWAEYDFDKCGMMVLEVIGNIHEEIK